MLKLRMQKKILFVWRHLVVGGAEISLSRIIDSIKNNYDISILCFRKESGNSLNINAINAPISFSISGSNNPIILFFGKIKFIIDLFKLARNNDTIVVSEIPLLNFSAWLIKKLYGKKVISWIHVDIAQLNLHHNLFIRKLFRFSLRNLDYIVCPSELAIKSMREFLGHQHHVKIVKIYNIIQMPEKQTLKRILSRQDNKLIFMSIGRLTKDKGFDILIKAYHEYFKMPQYIDSMLYIYGEGQQHAELTNLIDQLGLNNSVKLMGFISNSFDILPSCDIFISPSYTESLPFVTIEALICDKPLIITRTGATEVIEDGKYGEIVDIGDIHDLARKILLLASNQQLRKSYAAKAPLALKKFDNNIVINQWESIL